MQAALHDRQKNRATEILTVCSKLLAMIHHHSVLNPSDYSTGPVQEPGADASLQLGPPDDSHHRHEFFDAAARTSRPARRSYCRACGSPDNARAHANRLRQFLPSCSLTVALALVPELAGSTTRVLHSFSVITATRTEDSHLCRRMRSNNEKQAFDRDCREALSSSRGLCEEVAGRIRKAAGNRLVSVAHEV